VKGSSCGLSGEKIKIVKRRKYAKYSYQKLKLFLRNRVMPKGIVRGK
jgi:hypothetical protein